MQFDLPPLPYKASALAPYISKKALELHYESHQKGYLKRLNSLPEVVGLEGDVKIEDVILAGKRERRSPSVHVIPPKSQPPTVYNMAAQVYNHTFFFRSLKPKGGEEPVGDIAEIVTSQYGNYESFRKKIRARAKSLFGSGWIWIALDEDNDLRILQGLNADTPFVYGIVPLLTIDVWEHAYYLDYENDRGAYIDAVLDHLINWDFANENLRNIES
jgi:Fe-Mn family superoxide dismutase